MGCFGFINSSRLSYVSGTCIREIYFNKCDILVNSSLKKDEEEFRVFFGMRRPTYFRILNRLHVYLAKRIKQEDIDAAQDDEQEHTILVAVQHVQNTILTPNDRQRDTWRAERCLQYILMYYSAVLALEHLELIGFKSPKKLMYSMATLLRSIISLGWPIEVSTIDFRYPFLY